MLRLDEDLFVNKESINSNEALLKALRYKHVFLLVFTKETNRTKKRRQ